MFHKCSANEAAVKYKLTIYKYSHLFKTRRETLEKDTKSIERNNKQRHLNNINVVLVSLLLTLNISQPCSAIYIVDFEQVNDNWECHYLFLINFNYCS